MSEKMGRGSPRLHRERHLPDVSRAVACQILPVCPRLLIFKSFQHQAETTAFLLDLKEKPVVLLLLFVMFCSGIDELKSV